MTSATPVNAAREAAFAFVVTLVDAGSDTNGTTALPRRVDAACQEVSGLDARMRVEDIAEGGENRFVHRLPVSHAPGNLVLRRGVATAASPLIVWATQMVGATLGQPVETRTLLLHLRGPAGEPVRSWRFDHVWPVGLKDIVVSGADMLFGELELAYATVTRVDAGT